MAKEKKQNPISGYIISDKEKVVFKGKEVVSVLGEDKKNKCYLCRMSDNTKECVPIEVFYE